MWNWRKQKSSRGRFKTCPYTDTDAGFTLLEILIAVAILAGAFLALLSGQGSGFLASERAERMTVATNLARQKMADVEIKVEGDIGKGKFPDEEEESGVFSEPFEDYRWKYNLKKVEIPMIAGMGEEEADGAEASVGVGSYMETALKQISEAVREVQLTVAWGDKDKPEKDQPHLTITTHVVQMK